MGGVGLFLYFITTLVMKKDSLPLKDEISETNRKLVSSFKYWRIKPIIKNNFNIKPKILKLFYISWISDFLLFSFSILVILFCFGGSYIWRFIGYNKYDINSEGFDISWVAILIMNIIYVMTTIRICSDSLKLSFRGKYQKKYLNLLVVDILTLNIFSVIGIFIYMKNGTSTIQDSKVSDKFEFNNTKIKQYFRLINKVEVITFLFFLTLCISFLFIGHYIENNFLKRICLAITLISMVAIYAWSIVRLIGIILLKKFIKNIINTNSYHSFLTLVRILAYIYGYYYLAILINLCKADKLNTQLILEDW